MKNVLVLNPPNDVTKNMIRDLIYGCWCKGKRIGGTTSPPLNLLYVATTLKKAGHNIVFLDAIGQGYAIDDVKAIVRNIDAIIISTSSMSFMEDATVLHELKKVNSDMLTIMFGAHPTFMPKFCLSNGPGVDIIVKREPEITIRNIINNMDKNWKKTKGIGYREGKKIILNDEAPLLKNLDELPIPDRNLLPKDVEYFNPIVKRIPYTTAMTSRECPGRCTFCNVPRFYGNIVRSRSFESVANELNIITEQGYKEVWFRDETFTFFRDRNKKMCKYIIDNRLDITWIANARVGTISREDMILYKKAGCHMIKFGIESGSQDVLDKVKKGTTIELARKTFKWAKEIGMGTHAHMMIGMPGDTEKTVNQSINFVKEIEPTTVTFGVCTPYPGTELFDFVEKIDPSIRDGKELNLEKLHTTGEFNKHYCSLSNEQLTKLVKRAYRSFYFRPKYILYKIKEMRSLDEIRRTMIAGVNVFQFGMDEE